MRNRFDRQLEELNEMLIHMGELCETAIKEATGALEGHDIARAKAVITADSEIDQMEKEIENLCLKLLLQQQPVARDLRRISASLKMITDMERIGDQTADIADIVIATKSTEEKNLKDMIDSGVFSLQELKDYRIVNDMGCARLAAQNRTAEDIAALEKNIVRYGASVADIEALHVIDEEFHSILAAASHNAMVVAVNSAITEIIVTYFWNRAREFSSQKILHINQMAYEAHAALARAVISGDLEDAEKQMQRVNRAFHDATQ